jgi:hypothetical protein
MTVSNSPGRKGNVYGGRFLWTLNRKPAAWLINVSPTDQFARAMRQFVLELAKWARTSVDLARQRHDPERPTITTVSLLHAAAHDPRAKSDRTD